MSDMEGRMGVEWWPPAPGMERAYGVESVSGFEVWCDLEVFLKSPLTQTLSRPPDEGEGLRERLFEPR